MKRATLFPTDSGNLKIIAVDSLWEIHRGEENFLGTKDAPYECACSLGLESNEDRARRFKQSLWSQHVSDCTSGGPVSDATQAS